MKKLSRCFCALLLFILEWSAFQAASAEGYLYLFKKDFPPGDFNAVEAVTEEKSDGNLKLTTDSGKLTVWGENLLAGKFPLFDEAKEAPHPEELQASIVAMEKFVQESPASNTYLQGLINQRKELQARLQNKTVETTQTVDDAVGRFLSDAYSQDKTYSEEYLEAKLRRGEALKLQLPEQAVKITEYLKPWEEELKNRKAGLDRFEGKWQNAEAVAKMKSTQEEADRKSFFEKELSFSVPREAVSQNLIYIFAAVVGVSILLLLALLFHGLSNMSQGFGLGVIFSLLFGLGGLGAYGYWAWVLFQEPPGYAEAGLPKSDGKAIDAEQVIPVDEFIFRISQSAKDSESRPPARYLLEEPQLNQFLRTYLKMDSPGKSDAYAVTRRGLKIRVLADRVLIFDELSVCKKDLVAQYTFFYANNNNEFSFFKTEACLGGMPLPGKFYGHLLEQIQPLVSAILAQSKVLDNYNIGRMESGMIELISKRHPPKPANKTPAENVPATP